MAKISRLDGLNEDILYCILVQVAALRTQTDEQSIALKNLSTTCKRMRSYCMPVLFHECQSIVRFGGVPPEAIRAHVRHIKYIRAFHKIEEVYAAGFYNGMMVPMPLVDSSGNSIVKIPPPPPFGLELDYLPNVRAVTFLLCPGGVPWYALTKCLDYPNVTSISIDKDSAWIFPPPSPIPADLSPTSHGCRLTEFIYTPCQWRETQSRLRKTNIQPAYAYETSYLRALVLAMSDTAESLTLPVETAPLLEMANMDWPRLHTLSLTGRYTHPNQCRAIPLLLLRMPNLRSLSVKVMQCEVMRRPLLLKEPPDTSYRLRSLTISYPNPEDPIFSYIGDAVDTSQPYSRSSGRPNV
ncbi:uncharacterized protein TRAVEDRAFT_74799 [Trametes versicolor FP-101664 SS1]|uniref:uncharacterized protein n=1 Tax=Trametes versicolor (strain FP-101664) TaxID=717944 RepID=UPI0004622ABA|nr:uncharacterized protein TRAVEDRAFT_74799 [Trametes versicolor FP-101664 SS1]EIW53492.1 hypothetical protein TRAVEDRAFT_74799 [Trametes versicolor FP-101664 SS1]